MNCESERASLQKILDAEKNTEDRRKLGQFSTPYALAEDIVSYGLQLFGPGTDGLVFMDPAFGTGPFFSALNNNAKYKKAMGFEIDPHYGVPTKEMWKTENVDVIIDDFLCNRPLGESPNMVICNPPYVRHHLIPPDKKNLLQRDVAEEFGFSPSGLSGLYCYFMLATHKWLSENAISGWLVPSEFMDTSYGLFVKKYLLERVQLIRIHRFDPNELQFGDALVSSSVIWFKKCNEVANDDVLFTFGGTHSDPSYSRYISREHLKTEKKWTRFPLMGPRNNAAGVMLSEYFKVKRGIATGNNKFFILNERDISEMDLPKEFFRPILCSSRSVDTSIIDADSDNRPLLGNRTYLFDCDLSSGEIETNYPRLWDYLKKGSEGTSTRYLCKKRKEWYHQEKRDPSPIVCSYMGRGRPRFILNRSNVIATNSFLLLYPTEKFKEAFGDTEEATEFAWEFLQDIPEDLFFSEGRTYGGGLRKMEPGELLRVDVSGMYEFINECLRQGPKKHLDRESDIGHFVTT
jgi:hypothetical protein